MLLKERILLGSKVSQATESRHRLGSQSLYPLSMPATLSAELYSRIVDCVVPRRGDLVRLCMVCKAFQREAEVRLYGQVGLPDPRRTFLFAQAVIDNERYGPYTKVFWFHPPFPNGRDPFQILPEAFWAAFQSALAKMPNLKSLTALDHAKANSWVFDPARPFPFQLKEARLRVKWDDTFVHFLRTQTALSSLQLIDFPEPHTEETCQLPELVTFEGSLTAAAQFFATSPLRNMHLSVHKDSLPLLATLPSTIRGLTLLEVPEEMSMSALDLVSSRCPSLLHLGQFHLPVLKVRYPSPSFPLHLTLPRHIRSIINSLNSSCAFRTFVPSR